MAGFEQADAQLTAVAQQQFDLRAAVDAGELWMDADVAERAAVRCDQTTMTSARQVFANMADTFRTAGRTVAEADEAGQQMFRGKPE